MTLALAKRVPVLSQDEAHYRRAEDPARSCGVCEMFRAPNRCTLVKGLIEARMTCDQWAPTLTKSPTMLPPFPGPPFSHRQHCRALVLDAAGRLLQLRRAIRPHHELGAGQWETVSGSEGDDHAPPGETEFECIQREVEEETGFAGASLAWEKLAPHVWICRLPPGAGDPHISDEHDAYRWTSPEDASEAIARERFYGRIAEGIAKQGGEEISARILQAAQLGDWDSLAHLVVGPLGESATQGVLQSASDAALDAGALDVANTRAIDWAGQRAADLVTQIADSTRSDLRRLIEQALTEGWSPQDLSSAIEDAYTFSPERAAMIATTELAFAHSSGTIEGWRASGQVTGKRWLLAPDHDLDDDCDQNAAVGAIPLDASFPSGDDGPPAHPNCRCVVVPELMDEAAAEKLRKKYQAIAALPAAQVRGYTAHEKRIFFETFNAAWDEYGGDEHKAFAVAHAAVTRHRGVQKYSPDQPRDDHGRWSSGGGSYVTPRRRSSAGEAGGASSTAATVPPATQRAPSQTSEAATPSRSTTRATTSGMTTEGGQRMLGQGLLKRADQPRHPRGYFTPEAAPGATPASGTPLRWEARQGGAVATVLISTPGYAHGAATVVVAAGQMPNGTWAVVARSTGVAPVRRSGFATLAAAQAGAAEAVAELRTALMARGKP